MNILGISALYHDSAAALVRDGVIVAAAQEERFTRVKHDMSMPKNAIWYCLREAGISAEELDYVVYYDNPLLTTDRVIKNAMALKGEAESFIEYGMPSLLKEKLWVHKLVEEILGENLPYKFLVTQHHISHAASAFFPSPYENALIITNDGVGEWETSTIGIGCGNKIKIVEEIRYPHSIGLFYSALTYFCGFKVNSGDYKFMGLAPYGEPIYYDLMRKELIDIKEDGSYRLNLEYFDYYRGKTMVSEKMSILFDGEPRKPETDITKREMDIAASGQKIVEEIILKMAISAKKKYGSNIHHLVLAGGVALNCVANGKIAENGIFDEIWIQPAAGDAGGALGAALYTWYHYLENERKVHKCDFQQGSYLGNNYTMMEIEDYLKSMKFPYVKITEETELYAKIAKELSEEKVVGLFHGRMEFGPRALGNRSIIASPCSEVMQSKINLKIKYRESFRPFAPSVLEETAKEYFDITQSSPYMLLVAPVKEKRRNAFDINSELEKADFNMLKLVNQRRSDIPAVTHVDYSARIQSVSPEQNSYYYGIIKEFQKLTGYGVIVNTSFNVRGEPIVCSIKDAYECFMRTDMDVLVLENCILYKEEQPEYQEEEDWRNKYELD